MSEHNISSLLSYPFDEGVLARADGASTLVVNAPYWVGVSQFDNVSAVNAFYPDFQTWELHKIEAHPEILAGEKYDLILCALPKQKELAFFTIAQSLNALEEGGTFVCVAANDAGGKRIEKWIQELGVETQSLSKSKCRIAWAKNKGVNQNIVEKYLTQGAMQLKAFGDTELMTKPGIFGWNKIDQGSRLLTQYVPDDLSGVGVDFGCGYGFLSNYVLSNSSKIKKLYAIDADYHAVQCAQKNLEKFESVITQWADLTVPITFNRPLDFIVMNPPFHMGKKADSDIGQKFIETAHGVLKKSGALYMVANAHLPYEKLLERLFSTTEKCDEQNGFKVYKAIK